jgi:hypothetical protein
MSAQPSFTEPEFPDLSIDAPPEDATTSDDERTFIETHAADAKTVSTRKRASAFAASFNAVMRRGGLTEACNELYRLDRERDPETAKRISPNEIIRLYLTMIDAAQRAEYFAEESDSPYPKIRRFKASAATMEMYFKRLTMPPELVKGTPQYNRWLESRGRAWRRRWEKVHRVQSYLHLAFFEHEKGFATDEKKVPAHLTDNLTDLLGDVAGRARAKGGEPVSRYNRAADEALENFRATVPAYMPEWTPESVATTTETKVGSKKSGAPDSWAAIKTATRRLVEDALRVVREERLTEDEAFARRLELHSLIETLWTSEPQPEPEGRDGAACPHITSPPPVIVNADTAQSDVPVIGLDGAKVSYLNSEKVEKHSAKSQPSRPETSRLWRSPESEAEATAEAFESVGATELLATFLGIYPLKGDAKLLGSEPISAEQFKARAASYVKRSHERKQNVAVRAYGAFIQVDDCSREIFERLKSFAFFALETSPGNYQVWLALPSAFAGSDGKINEEGKAIRKRLLKKFEENGETANGGAYGSTRLPGTLNIKEKYQPTFPLIRLAHIATGRIVTPEELEAEGLLAAVPVRPVLTVVEAPRDSNSKLPKWPDYQYYVSRAPLKEDGQPNLSRADESFVVRCYSLGHSRHSIAAKLRSVRDKAARRDDYVERTLNAAESYLAAQPQTVFNVRIGARERMVI